MAITMGGFNLPITTPVEGAEGFQQPFFRMFDGQVNLIGASGATITAGQAFSVWGFNDPATGGSITLTLPSATGSLMRIFVFEAVIASSNSHIIKTSPLTDSFGGLILGARTDSLNTVLGFPGTVGGTNSNTITLNRTTTGSVNKGEWLEFIDVQSGVWNVKGILSSTGAAFATPFSHS